MQAMIERIGDIAQSDARREAQIKLLPSALGALEVKIVQRDEQMHVTLTSDNAQARQLLSDAAPRLQELAEARGLRFAQADIGGGQPQDRRTPAEQQAQTPLRPTSAAPEQDAQDQPTGDLIA
jgi:flagellar hook-length control protein FliK